MWGGLVCFCSLEKQQINKSETIGKIIDQTYLLFKVIASYFLLHLQLLLHLVLLLLQVLNEHLNLHQDQGRGDLVVEPHIQPGQAQHNLEHHFKELDIICLEGAGGVDEEGDEVEGVGQRWRG